MRQPDAGPPPPHLKAVTSDAALLCRVGERKGHLAVGYDADILAVAGNPFEDLSALHQVAAVCRLGRKVSPTAG